MTMTLQPSGEGRPLEGWQDADSYHVHADSYHVLATGCFPALKIKQSRNLLTIKS